MCWRSSQRTPKYSKVLQDKHHSWATVLYSPGQIQADVYVTKGMEYGLQKISRLKQSDCWMWQAPRVSLQQFWFEQSTSWPANYRPAVTSSFCGRLFELLTVKAVCAEEKQHSNHICEHIIFLHFIDVYGVILRLLCTPPRGAVAYVPLAGAGWMPNCQA